MTFTYDRRYRQNNIHIINAPQKIVFTGFIFPIIFFGLIYNLILSAIL